MQRLIAQRRREDCGIACIALAFRIRYEDVFVAAVRSAPRWKQDGGLTVREMMSTARRLGRRLVRVSWQRVDLDEHIGILGVNWNRPKKHASFGHWVVLREGTIIDPIGPDLWDAEEFLKTENGRIGTLLVEH